MPYKPLVPPQPKSAQQIEADENRKLNDAAWAAIPKPKGKLAFVRPKKDASEMTRSELANAWSSTTRKREEDN